MEQNIYLKTIHFFSSNKFYLGLFSFIYTGLIVFFILLAIILPLNKAGKIRIADFVLIGIPAWVLIALVLALAGSGKWGLYPHWLFTAFKRITINTQEREIHFTTGFWPILFNKKYSFDIIDSLVLTSRSVGDFGRKERFGFKVRLKNSEQWTFFTMFPNEQELRTKVKDLVLVLDCQLSDLTYDSVSTIEGKIKYSTSTKYEQNKYNPNSEEAPGDSTVFKIPRGIKERKLEDNSSLFLISKRHEWLAFILLIGIWCGIYILTWISGWTSPSKPGTWEGAWILLTAVLIFLSFKALVPIKHIQLDRNDLFYRLYFLGIPLTSKKMSLNSITKITRQQTELFVFRLVIISGQMTIKVYDLNRDMAIYLEETLLRFLNSLQSK